MWRLRGQQRQQCPLLARGHAHDLPVDARLDGAQDRDLQRHGRGQPCARSHPM
jgi:hypothetical protein